MRTLSSTYRRMMLVVASTLMTVLLLRPQQLPLGGRSNLLVGAADATRRRNRIHHKSVPSISKQNHPKSLSFLFPKAAATTKSKSTTSKDTSKKSFYQWYLQCCTERPFVTKGITAGCISSLGDFIAQYFEQYHTMTTMTVNVRRLVTFFLTGALYSAPFVHIWYGYVAEIGRWMDNNNRRNKSKSKNFSIRQQSRQHDQSPFLRIFVQVFIDQTLGTMLYFPLYLIAYDMLEHIVLGQLPSFTDAIHKCQTYIQQVIWMQYRIFPIVNTINFAVIPEQLRVLFSNVVNLFWNIYLCSLVAAAT